jgi:hypothetical protein
VIVYYIYQALGEEIYRILITELMDLSVYYPPKRGLGTMLVPVQGTAADEMPL